MYAIRSENDQIITSCELDTIDEEITYDTEKEAEEALKVMEKSIPKGIFKVIEI